MADVNINVQLKVIGDGVKAVEKSTKQLVELEKAAQSVGGSFKRIGEVALGTFGGGLLVKGFEAGISAALSFAKTLTTDSIAAAISQEDAINRLNNALASGGNFTKEASQDFQDFASQLQATTKFQDDAVISTGALIASLTGLSGAGLKSATQATADLATALGTDLDSASRLVSKALEGNTHGLARYGIEIKKGKNDTEQLANVVDALNQRFGGAARGAVNTFSGSLALLNNSFGDLQEEIGFVITQNPVIISVFKSIGESIRGVSEFIKNNQGQVQVFVSGVLSTATTIATVISTILDTVVRGIDSVFRAISQSVLSVTDLFNAIGLAAEGKFTAAFDVLKNRAGDAANDIQDAFSGDTFLGGLTTEFAKVEQSATDAFDALKSGASTSIDPINAVIAKTKELTSAQILLAEQGVALANAAKTTAASDAAFALEQQKLALEAGLLTQQEFFTRQQEIRAEQYNLELLALQAALEQEKITREQFEAGQLAAAQKLTQDLNKNDLQRRKFREEENKRNIQAVSDTFGNIAQLQSAGGRTAFEIGRAAAIAQATVNTYQGVSNALAGPPTGPPYPLNIIFAASQAVALGAQISRLAGASPPGLAAGLTQVPPGFNNDTFPAFLNSGERVISGPQNEDLKEFLNDSRGNQGLLSEISSKLSALQNQVVVNIGGKEIVNVLNDEIDSGRVLRTA